MRLRVIYLCGLCSHHRECNGGCNRGVDDTNLYENEAEYLIRPPIDFFAFVCRCKFYMPVYNPAKENL